MSFCNGFPTNRDCAEMVWTNTTSPGAIWHFASHSSTHTCVPPSIHSFIYSLIPSFLRPLPMLMFMVAVHTFVARVLVTLWTHAWPSGLGKDGTPLSHKNPFFWTWKKKTENRNIVWIPQQYEVNDFRFKANSNKYIEFWVLGGSPQCNFKGRRPTTFVDSDNLSPVRGQDRPSTWESLLANKFTFPPWDTVLQRTS